MHTCVLILILYTQCTHTFCYLDQKMHNILTAMSES
jgi:hypothetical protein